MNRRLNILWVLLFTSCLFSCKDEVNYGIGEYRADWVKVHSPNTFSMLNREETLLIGDRSLSNTKEGDRIILNYSRLNVQEDGYAVKVNGGSAVFCDTVKQRASLSEQLKSSPVQVESVWMGLCYLNLTCYVDRYGKGPVAALILDRVVGDTYYLSFIYDKRTDPAGSRTKVICSFDVSNIAGMPANDKKMIVAFDDERNKTFQFNY